MQLTRNARAAVCLLWLAAAPTACAADHVNWPNPGNDKAGDYIAEVFKGAGLEPAGDEGTYFQKFKVGSRYVSKKTKNKLIKAGWADVGTNGKTYINPFYSALRRRRNPHSKLFGGPNSYIATFRPGYKTKVLHGALSKILAKGKILLVDAKFETTSTRAARNLARVSTAEASSLNVTELCRYDRILLTSSALDAVVNRLKGA